MRPSRFLPLLALCFLAAGERNHPITVRFYSEANSRDSNSFSTPIKLGNPPRDAFLQKIPTIHDRHVRSIFPFRAPDGTWGCAFQLDPSGRLALEVLSMEKRGTYLVGIVATQRGNHRVQDLVIDRKITDGIISIGKGLTDLEIAMLGKQFKVIGGAEIPKAPKQSGGWWIFGKKKAPAA